MIKGKKSGLEFFAGYIVEQSLSVDNLFIFIMLFDYFKVPAEFQVKHAAFWVAWGGVGDGCGGCDGSALPGMLQRHHNH